MNNGNVNINNRTGTGFARACRLVPPRQSQGIELRDLHSAWRRARRRKKPSHNQISFEANWLDNLLTLQSQLTEGTWTPSRTTCFIAAKPKAREIHAPDFSDRVVHHWLVPQLESIFQPGFIVDSYSNQAGKGTHSAVERLIEFVQEVHSGQGGGFFLQLDIHNFFNSLHRPTLYAMLKAKMQRYGLPDYTQRTVHALLRRSPLEQGVDYRATRAERQAVPLHKRLENAAPGCGLPIGNLSSQFFANVYLNELDQFIKHTLKAQRYLRYVDDFVLVHESREQLEIWKGQIEAFLAERLRLKLKADVRLQPLANGIDFLGYIVKPTHTRVRRRVIAHARERLSGWERAHVSGHVAKALPADFRAVRSIWSSYSGHFRHADAQGLTADFHRRYPWLAATTSTNRQFRLHAEGRRVAVPFAAGQYQVQL